MYSAKKKRPSM
jgi:hypothetical protein